MFVKVQNVKQKTESFFEATAVNFTYANDKENEFTYARISYGANNEYEVFEPGTVVSIKSIGVFKYVGDKT